MTDLTRRDFITGTLASLAALALGPLVKLGGRPRFIRRWRASAGAAIESPLPPWEYYPEHHNLSNKDNWSDIQYSESGEWQETLHEYYLRNKHREEQASRAGGGRAL